MAEIIGDRVAERIDILGINMSELARRTGVKQPSISKIINNQTRGSKFLPELARELQTSINYLIGETDDPSPPATGEARAPFHAGGQAEGFSQRGKKPDPDTVTVAQFDIALGMGGGGYLDNAEGEPMAFSRAWLRQFTKTPPDQLLWAHGMGDSMVPTINEADVMLIDTADRTPRISDKIWAIDFCGLGMVKRLRASAGGGMRILSDNPLVPEDMAVDGEMNVIGRVVAIVRRV